MVVALAVATRREDGMGNDQCRVPARSVVTTQTESDRELESGKKVCHKSSLVGLANVNMNVRSDALSLMVTRRSTDKY